MLDGLIAISATFGSDGLTELFHCYGFLAVFVTALTFRHADKDGRNSDASQRWRNALAARLSGAA